MQERSIDELNSQGISKKFREFFGQLSNETEDVFRQRMAEQANKKLMNLHTQTFKQVKIGRNDSCPCNSGKKFKKCCIDKINKGESGGD